MLPNSHSRFGCKVIYRTGNPHNVRARLCLRWTKSRYWCIIDRSGPTGDERGCAGGREVHLDKCQIEHLIKRVFQHFISMLTDKQTAQWSCLSEWPAPVQRTIISSSRVVVKIGMLSEVARLAVKWLGIFLCQRWPECFVCDVKYNGSNLDCR